MRQLLTSAGLVTALCLCLAGVGAAGATSPEIQRSPLQPIHRVWTDSSGMRQQAATLVEVRGDTARFLLPPGSYASIKTDRLSPKDQAFARAFGRLSQTASSTSAWRDTQNLPRTAAPTGEGSPRAAESAPGGFTAFGIPDLGKLSLLGTQSSEEMPVRLMVVLISPRFFEHYFRPDVDEARPVQDVILGRTFRGTSRTTGLRAISFVSNNDEARVDLLFTGTSISETMGGDTVEIHSRATTYLEASKRVVLSEAGITSRPTTTTANCTAENTGYNTALPGLRGRIAKRVAVTSAGQTRQQVNEESARHSEQATNREIDKGVASSLASLDDGLRRILAAGRSSDLNLRLRCSTTSDQVRCVVHRKVSGGLPAETCPSAIRGAPAMAVWIHSSLVKRMLVDPTLRQALEPLLGTVMAGDTSSSAAGADARSTGPSNGQLSPSPPSCKLGWTEDGKWLTVSLDFPAEERSGAVAAAGH